MRKPVLALALAAGLLGTGCFNHLVYDSAAMPEPNPVYDHWQHHLLYGLATVSPPIDLRELCPYGVAQAENYVSFANFLLWFFTVGLYAPTNLEVYCAVAKEVVMVAPPGLSPTVPQPPGVVVLPPTPTTNPTPEPTAPVVISPTPPTPDSSAPAVVYPTAPTP